MEQRKEEFIKTLVESCACAREDAVKEVEESIHRLFHWAAYADKYGGNVQVGKAIISITICRDQLNQPDLRFVDPFNVHIYFFNLGF